ncbi:MAG: alpha/beta hydrolase [Ruminiclostridium sp.]|nr:alpha/beta hydrolase [Ruminiclostridium sp.]
MKIHEFGERGRGNIVMIHGECMPWELFREAVDALAARFRVYAVSVPGHDITSDEEYTSVEDVASRIELTLARYGVSRIDLLYGFSLGGALALRIAADGSIPVTHAVIDAGTTPRPKQGFLDKLLSPSNPLKRAKYSRPALDKVFPPQNISAASADRIYLLMQRMSDNTMDRIFRTMYAYELPEVLSLPNCTFEYWYGSEEADSLKADIEYVSAHIPGIVLRSIAGMSHGQYVLSSPSQFAGDIGRRML